MPLGKRTDFGDAKFSGVECEFACDADSALQTSGQCGFDFVVMPLVRPDIHEHKDAAVVQGSLPPPYLPSDVLFAPLDCSSQVVGRVSSWICPDSTEVQQRRQSEVALLRELEWAAHLSLQAVVIPIPQTIVLTNYARTLLQFTTGLSNMALWLLLPLASTSDQRGEGQEPLLSAAGPGTYQNGHNHGSRSSEARGDSWECWNRVRCLCDHAPQLGLALEIPVSLPSQGEIERWIGEPVRALVLPTSVFTTNRRGYPALSRAHQALLLKFLSYGVQHFARAVQPLQMMLILTPPSWHIQQCTNRRLRSNAMRPCRSGQQVRQHPAQHKGPPFAPMHASSWVPVSGTALAMGAGGPDRRPKALAPTSSLRSGIPHPSDDSSGRPGWTVVSGSNGRQPSPLRMYWEYLSYLFRRPEALPEQEQLEMGYRDYLQVPLQPLQDNLESQTYEVFEKDTTKYKCYEEAIALALNDRAWEQEHPTTTPHESSNPSLSEQQGGTGGVSAGQDTAGPSVIIMVVGAGRGPLVRASLSAGQSCGCRVKVWAVEKNPNAVITLHRMVAAEGWGELVTVVGEDMRSWQPPELAHILVSELLGSFGDNELSPECLDGAQRLLAPGGISIPSSYTSHLQPVTASKLWSDARAYKDLEHFETPYVAKLHRVSHLAAPQPVFTFEHPSSSPGDQDNSRYACLRFPRKGAPAALCHGFAGYFETVLYRHVTLSTHPQTHTPNMFSWFPIFFPLREPVCCPSDSDVELHMWRCTSPHKVWYEWSLACPAVTNIHNVGGRSYHVGL